MARSEQVSEKNFRKIFENTRTDEIFPRSATVALAYLLRYGGLSLAQAVTRVKQHRDIRPNIGFISQLIEFEKQCNK